MAKKKTKGKHLHSLVRKKSEEKVNAHEESHGPQSNFNVCTHERYELNNCKAKVIIQLGEKEGEFVPFYDISFPEIGEGTRITLDEVKIEILSQSKLPVEKMVDLKFAEQVKKDFSDLAYRLLSNRITGEDKKKLDVLVELLIN
ncbi:MAG: hypothetical protein AABW59_01530, partial [archaeon]